LVQDRSEAMRRYLHRGTFGTQYSVRVLARILARQEDLRTKYRLLFGGDVAYCVQVNLATLHPLLTSLTPPNIRVCSFGLPSL
jgi:hypothetical protein